MPEFSTVLNYFLSLLQPYRKLGYVKREKVTDFFPEIHVGNNQKVFIAIVNPVSEIVERFEGFEEEWFTTFQNIPKPVTGVLKLQVEFKNNKYYITGDDLNVVEIFYALPKAWHANEEEQYYRVVRHKRRDEKRTVSYTNNFMNRGSLEHFQTCVNKVNRMYKDGTRITNRLRSRTGNKILGFTTEVTFPEHIQEVIDDLRLTLPGKYGPVRFGKSGAYKYLFNVDGVDNEIIPNIYPIVCNVYKNVYCRYLQFNGVDGAKAQEFGYFLGEFIRGDCTVAGLTYGDMKNNDPHARLLVKNGNDIELYDPWIQGILRKKIVVYFQKTIKRVFGMNFVKVDRPPEQTDFEGSCVLNALCRVITAAEGDVTQSNLKEWVPVFVQMLVKHFVGTAMDVSIVKLRQHLKF